MRSLKVMGGVALFWSIGCGGWGLGEGIGDAISDWDLSLECGGEGTEVCSAEDAQVVAAPEGPVAVGGVVRFSLDADCLCADTMDALDLTLDPPDVGSVWKYRESSYSARQTVEMVIEQPGPFAVSWTDGLQSFVWESEALEVDEVSFGAGTGSSVRHIPGNPAIYRLEYRGQGQALAGEFEVTLTPDWLDSNLATNVGESVLLVTPPVSAELDTPVALQATTAGFEATVEVIPTDVSAVDGLEWRALPEWEGMTFQGIQAFAGEETVVGVYPEWRVSNEVVGAGDVLAYTVSEGSTTQVVELSYGSGELSSAIAMDEGAFAIHEYELWYSYGCNSTGGATSGFFGMIAAFTAVRLRRKVK